VKAFGFSILDSRGPSLSLIRTVAFDLWAKSAQIANTSPPLEPSVREYGRRDQQILGPRISIGIMESAPDEHDSESGR
jgi:hypothetical protein